MFTSANRESDSSKTGAPPTGEHAPPEPAATEPNPRWHSLATHVSGVQTKRSLGAQGAPAQPEFAHDAVQENLSHQIAWRGIEGSAQTLPHLATIQPLFGRYELTSLAAHTDQRATDANHALGALGYTLGNHVAFAGAPALHTAAHEAAHAIQQRTRLQLKDGQGQLDDRYEQQAGAVAYLVVQGKSAEGLLGECAAAPVSAFTDAGTLQRQTVGGKTAASSSPITLNNPYGYQWNSPSTTVTTSQLGLAIPSVLAGVGTLEDVRKGIDEISKNAVKGEAKFGTYTKGGFTVNIPVPDIPGLFLTIHSSFDYVRSGEEQELKMQLAVGIKWEFRGYLSASINETNYLKLEGNSLGDAFVDALKQITRQMLITSGTELKFLLLIADLKSEWLWNIYKDYLAFFKNNPNVGFEVARKTNITLEAKGEIGKMKIGGKLAGEAIFGLEDIDKKRVVSFDELAFSTSVKVGDSKAVYRYSRRLRKDGSRQAKHELEVEFPGELSKIKEIVFRVKTFLAGGAMGNAIRTQIADNEGNLDVNALLQAAVTIIKIPGAKQKLGLEISYEKEWSPGKFNRKVQARIKEIQGIEKKSSWDKSNVTKVLFDMESEHGAFLDISGEIESYLSEKRPGK